MYTQFCLWSEPELSLTGPFYRYDLGKTFEIVVGKQPNQKSFTAYHDLLTQRSEFFRAARSERWSQDPKKPTTLDDVDVEIFSTYLHCVNWGAEFLDAPVQTILDENRHIYEEETIIKIAGDSSSGGDNTKGSDNDSSSDDEGSDESDSGDESTATDPDEVDHSIMQSTRPIETFLIDLYLLADKLIDPTTANLAIDKLVDFIEERETYLSARLTRFVYKTTMVGSPLRRLVLRVLPGQRVPRRIHQRRPTRIHGYQQAQRRQNCWHSVRHQGTSTHRLSSGRRQDQGFGL
jgi:hypothetical protein